MNAADYPQMSSSALRARIQKGNVTTRTWREFHRRYFGWVRDRCKWAGLPPADAEDMAHQVINGMCMEEKIAKYTPPEKPENVSDDPAQDSFKSWLSVVTRNAALNYLRRKTNREETLSPKDIEEYKDEKYKDIEKYIVGAIDEFVLSEVTVKAIERLKKELTDQQMAILISHSVNGASHQAIAENFGFKNADSAKTQVYKLKKRLREKEDEIFRE